MSTRAWASRGYLRGIVQVTSAGVPDPYVPVDGNWNVTGDLTATGDVQGGTVTSDGLLTVGGIVAASNHLRFDVGVAMVATAYAVGRDADATNQLHFNVPTGAGFEWSVNDVAQMVLGGSTPFLNLTSSASGISYNGQITNARLSSTADAATSIPIVAKGAASQSANIFEARNSADTILVRVGSDGTLTPGTGDLTDLGTSALAWRDLYQRRDNIGTVHTAIHRHDNSQPASVGAQQFSPATVWRGNGWKTDAIAASQTVEFALKVEPVQGAASPTGLWRLSSSINSAAQVNCMTVSTVGLVTAFDAILISGTARPQMVNEVCSATNPVLCPSVASLDYGIGGASGTSVAMVANNLNRIEADATGIGVFAVAPVARASAYTQTFATATKTHAARTVGVDIGLFSDPPTAAQMADLRTFVNALKADAANSAQVANAVIDDLQAYGWLQ